MTETVGERTVQAIKDRAKQNGTKKSVEAEKLGISRRVMCGWDKSRTDPSAYFLQQMALHGYDIYWILTGKEKEND